MGTQAILVDALVSAGVVAGGDQAAVLRSPIVGVLGHRPCSLDPTRIHPEGRVDFLRSVLGSAHEHLPISGIPEDASTGQRGGSSKRPDKKNG